MSTETASTWIGWHREGKRSPWRALVTADSEDAAFRQLLDAAKGGDKCVLPQGVDPNRKQPAMRRRCF